LCIGDSAWNVKRALSFIENELPGVYINSIQIGENIGADVENSYFMNVNDQVDLVCRMIQNDTQLLGGYNAIGLSQGGQFL
jgi:palmitoyl-protein thioesterase